MWHCLVTSQFPCPPSQNADPLPINHHELTWPLQHQVGVVPVRVAMPRCVLIAHTQAQALAEAGAAPCSLCLTPKESVEQGNPAFCLGTRESWGWEWVQCQIQGAWQGAPWPLGRLSLSSLDPGCGEGRAASRSEGCTLWGLRDG